MKPACCLFHRCWLGAKCLHEFHNRNRFKGDYL